jgi:hypothetical protein
MKAPSAKELYALVQERNLLSSWTAVPDSRIRARIPLPQAAHALVFAPALGFNSLMRVDDFSRLPEAKKMGVAPVSDSLLQQLVATVPLKTADDELSAFYRQSVQSGSCELHLTNPTRPRLRVGHVDGTTWLTHFWVVLTVSGAFPIILRIRWMQNIGEELKEAQYLAIKAFLELGPDVAPELLTFDGKHVDYRFLRNWKALRRDFLVRVRGDDGRNLRVVREIETRVAAQETGVTLAYRSHPHSGCRYTLWRVEVPEPTYGGTLVGFKVKVEYFKGKRAGTEETHYGFTSAEYLNAEDLLTVRLSHWEIETRFRTLKHEFWSRHSYLEGAHEAQVVGSLVCLSLNLRELYDYQRRSEEGGDSRDRRRKRRLTVKQVATDLFRTLILWGAETQASTAVSLN